MLKGLFIDPLFQYPIVSQTSRFDKRFNEIKLIKAVSINPSQKDIWIEMSQLAIRICHPVLINHPDLTTAYLSNECAPSRFNHCWNQSGAH